MPLPYSHAATSFGHNLATTFQCINGPAQHSPSEVAKFNNLIQSFTILGTSGFEVSSYHGSVSQVEFAPAHPWTRNTPRCELADVLFVTYDTTQIRICFLQAKSKIHHSPYPVWLCNTEQYVVLSQRPQIANWVGSVEWNDDVLSNAILPSVGSFGIFCGSPGTIVQFHYLAADLLNPITTPVVNKYVSGSFDQPHGSVPSWRKIGQFTERTYCTDLADFGAALYSLEIGTPIHDGCGAGPAALNARMALSNWAKIQSVENPDDSLLQDLLDTPHLRQLEGTQVNENGSVGTNHVVVIKAADDEEASERSSTLRQTV